jgi:ribosomal protein L2
MYSKIKECVIAEVVSDVNFEKSTDLKISELKKEDGKASYIISEEGEFEFRPITRDIRIIRDNVMFTDKRRLGTMKTLVKITNDEHKKNIMDYVDK